jgi:hypothetical protein
LAVQLTCPDGVKQMSDLPDADRHCTEEWQIKSRPSLAKCVQRHLHNDSDAFRLAFPDVVKLCSTVQDKMAVIKLLVKTTPCFIFER